MLLLALIAAWTGKQLIVLLRLLSDMEKGKKWVKIEAEVLDARILDKGEASQARFTSFRRAYFFALYNFEGREFGIRKTSFYPKETSSDRAYVSRIGESKKVDIYINPKAPHESVLIPPIGHGYLFVWFKMMMGIGAISIVTYFMVVQ